MTRTKRILGLSAIGILTVTALGYGQDGNIMNPGMLIDAIKQLGAQVQEHHLQLELHTDELQYLSGQLEHDEEGGIAGAVTSFDSVSGVAFHPSNDSVAFSKSSQGVSGTTSGSLVQFKAPIQLPHGAIVTGFELQAIDNDAAQNMNVQLVFINSTGGSGAMATLNTSGNVSGTRTFSTTNITQSATIDNQTRGYMVNAFWIVPAQASNMRLVRASVSYTLP